MQPRKAASLISLFIAAGCTNGGPNDPSGTFTNKLIGDGPFGLHSVAKANPKVTGSAEPNIVSQDLILSPVAVGTQPVENPATVALGGGATAVVGHYGYAEDAPQLPAPGDVPSATHLVEASKTEPDKNTYLELFGQVGPDATYDYGTHFIFQGHESGPTNAAGDVVTVLTRINLDADGAHKVTVMASADKTGAPLPTIDGSTWNPFSQRLLLTSENGAAGGVFQATLGFPSVVEQLAGSFGHAGYEGIQNDSAGDVWVVEDAGGATSTATPHAKAPNSFIYRFVPKRSDDNSKGKLQVLQVISLRSGKPITFHGTDDTLSGDVQDLHTYGNVFDTKWITIHDTDVDGSTAFDANALAKSKGGTPFKRPENAQFRPGTSFKEFFFDETGDTDSRTEAGTQFGGFGSIMKLAQTSPTANVGKLSLFFLGDLVHNSFDNCGFLSKNQVVFVEDAGDTLHAQRNALDSAWALDVTLDYSNPANQPVRLLAQGRDASATLDSAFSSFDGFQNEGDNEITGFHVSNGDPSTRGILGATVPKQFKDGWRWFYTQQHGDNVTWEILPSATAPALIDE